MSALMKEKDNSRIRRGVVPLPSGKYPINHTAIMLGISEPTLFRYIKDNKIQSSMYAGLRIFSKEAMIEHLVIYSGFSNEEAKLFIESNEKQIKKNR